MLKITKRVLYIKLKAHGICAPSNDLEMTHVHEMGFKNSSKKSLLHTVHLYRSKRAMDISNNVFGSTAFLSSLIFSI